MRPTHIILHHSATQDGKTLSWDDIKRYHLQTNGWKDIGYHYGIEQIEADTMILVGRMLDEAGAHCVGMNAKSLGVCFVGNFGLAEPPKESWDAGIRLVSSLCRVFGIPHENVQGHRDFSDKTCPGRKFDLALFRSQLTGGNHA